MIAFIDDLRAAYGVEPHCKVLPIAPSTYHDHAAKRLDPTRLSVRAQRDQTPMPEIARVFAENFEVYGARKVWRQLARGCVRRPPTKKLARPPLSQRPDGEAGACTKP